jgi:adhesin/invasin
MAKNLTRKGIAFGALVALGASAFAGTPAFAADPVSLDPTAGTSYSTILGESFSVTSLFTDAAQAGSEHLDFLVTDASSSLDTTAAGVQLNGADSAGYTLDTNKQFVVVGGITQAPASNVLKLKASTAAVTAAANFSATVQAFLDYNGNGKLDAGESASAVRTITWVAPTNVTATTTVTAPIAGDTSVVAKVSFDGLNNEQISESHLGAQFTKGDGTAYYSAVITGVTAAAGTNTYATTSNNLVNGDVVTVAGFTQAGNNVTGVVSGRTGSSFAIVVAGGTTATHAATATATRVGALAAWNAVATGDQFKTTATVPALVAAEAVKVQPLYSAAGTPLVANTIGAAKTVVVAATSVANVDATIAQSNVARTGAVASARTADVAKDSAFTVNIVAKDNASTPAPVAGKTVTYTVTLSGTSTNWFSTAALYAASSSTTKATLTVNGVTYTNAADLATANTAGFSGVTDAKGNVAVSIASKNLLDSAVINVTPSVEHATATTAVATVKDATYTATVTSGALTSIVAGGSSSATVKVLDQFGKPVADGYDARAQITSTRTGTGATAATGSVFAPLVNGVATLNFVDNGVGLGTNSYAIDIVKRDATTGSYGAALTGTTTQTALVNIVSAADLVAGKIVLTAGGTLVDSTVAGKYATTGNIVTADFGTYNPADVLGTYPDIGGGTRLTGNVKSASTATYVGVAVKGALVTISAPGVQFSDVVSGRWTLDSITVPTDANGVFDVYVYSHKAGDVTYTITSGSQSITDVITYAAPAATTGAAVTIDAPATALPGTTIKVVATVVDKFGNTVATVPGATAATFKLVIAGIGAGSTDTAATDGSLTKYVVLGAADTGSLTVTATYDADGAGATSAAVTKTATVKVATAAAAKTAIAVGADQAQTGAAVDVIATATDAAGKPAAGVVVTFDNVGQGYLSSTTATTDANGVAKVKLVGNVAGRNTLTATANGATAATAGVSFGAADANITVKGKRVTVTYEYAGLAKVVVSVNGTRKPAVYPADDNEGTFSFNLKAGTNKIAVSIAGKTVDSKTVKIKK